MLSKYSARRAAKVLSAARTLFRDARRLVVLERRLLGALALIFGGALHSNACQFGYDYRPSDPMSQAGSAGEAGQADNSGGEGGRIGDGDGEGGEGGAPELAVCGNGIVEKNENCDEGLRNGLYYGDGTGCTKFCSREPNCRDVESDGCISECGDGLLVSPEDCDDGNMQDGDGCSNVCSIEEGFSCNTETLTDIQPCSSNRDLQCLKIPIVYRDFIALGFPGGHEDMLLKGNSRSPENGGQTVDATWQGVCANMVHTTLNEDGKPRLRPDYAGCEEVGGLPVITSAETFLDWYSEDHPGSATYLASLELQRTTESATFRFNSNLHFPLDGLTQGGELEYCAEEDHLLREPLGEDPCTTTHNYHFTSEVRYIFRYHGGETLDFRGDDDVWVFVNGQKALDLGGVHGAASGSVLLDEQGLTLGRIYEILVFHAERHPVSSMYQLTLKGFDLERTSCERN